ncbi:MAG: AbrB/MazE/SpoVT family DNA-binding domain-containing protein [Anaerolineae bacterium]|nr:AbrB/MazE/SpoVT family DNA-binding domain-containing protein [Anaerolineae bacterium]
MPTPPEGKRFYGSVTVSERGQIVIPAEARRDFGIEVGEKLLVFGDLEQGLALMKASKLIEKMPGIMSMLQSAENEDDENK